MTSDILLLIVVIFKIEILNKKLRNSLKQKFKVGPHSDADTKSIAEKCCHLTNFKNWPL